MGKRKLAELNAKTTCKTYNSLLNRESQDSANEPQEETKQYQLTCPVCLSSDKFKSESDLTIHVEDCLSRQAISCILKQEKRAENVVNGKSSKRKKPGGGGSTYEPPCKRPDKKTIDSY